MWQTPKTNWTNSDRFNMEDYNRIKNNLRYLWEEVCDMWKEFEIEDMGEDITSYKQDYNFVYFNAFESNVDIINKNMFTQNYGMRQNFYPNGVFIKFDELNRIESAILKMKQIIDGKKAGMKRLPFRLGAPKGLYL